MANNLTAEDFTEIWAMVDLMCLGTATAFKDEAEQRAFKREQFSAEVARRIAASTLPPPPPAPVPQPAPQVHVDVQALATALRDSTQDMRSTVQRGFKSCNASLTLQSVARGLPLKAAHELRQAIPALAPNHVAASDIKPRDLTTFWRACERGLVGLG